MRSLLITFVLISTFLVLSGCDTANQVLSSVNTAMGDKPLTQGEAAQGVREALSNGITKGADRVSMVDGYFGSLAIKLLFPPDAVKVEQKLRDIGLGSEADKVILSLNRAAEDAAQAAKPIFIEAIRNLSMQDALNIVRGSDNAATEYLRSSTSAQLVSAFRPSIESSLTKVNATKYWADAMSTYNKIPFVTPVNTDLSGYVTQKAIDGLFVKVAEEEKLIRTDPIARTSDILKRVFGAGK